MQLELPDVLGRTICVVVLRVQEVVCPFDTVDGVEGGCGAEDP